MKSALKSGGWMAAAILAVAMVGAALADEPAAGGLQQSWNDYPAKWIENSKTIPATAYPVPSVETPSVDVPEQSPPAEIITPDPLEVEEDTSNYYRRPPFRPPVRPPLQQQQSSSGGGFNWGGGKDGGGFNWGGGKNGGGFNWGGGKDGGGSSWGKTRPPQSQQGSIPSGGQGTPDRDQLLEQLRELQRQNAMLKELLQRLAAQQAGGERSPGLPSEGVPLQ
ncbi:MAG: hypothetical protein ACYC6Y_01300 [Thermoguttaceae bacterium]